MNQQEILASLQSRGLRAWQASFAASFLNADSSTFQLLAAPPGTGKTYVSVAIAAELVARQAKRILILSPNMILCEQWTARLGDISTIPVVLVTRRVFREMEAALPIGQSPWKSDGIYVISLDLAKQEDFAIGLSAVDWDLVIVDEAHRLAAPQRAALLDRLLGANVVRRLLLLSATPLPALHQWLYPLSDQPARFPSPLVITSWYGELQNWDGSTVERSPLRWSVYGYKRSPEEVRCLSLFFRRKDELINVSGGNDFLTQILTQRVSSSLFAFEQSLQRLKHTLRSTVQQEEVFLAKDSMAQSELPLDFDDTEPTTADLYPTWTDKQTGLEIIDEWIQAVETITLDEKLHALKRLIASILGITVDLPRICLFSAYADTISYLHTAFEEVGLSLFKATGATSLPQREDTINRFLNQGGLLLGTDAALSEGIAMLRVSHIIHYDLPLNPQRIEQRCGRFDRFGRDTPLTMHLLLDESGTIPFETHLINKITSEQRRGIDDVLPTIDPLKKPSE
jgi:superfamily II DNA or RNA helicase